MKKKVSSKFNTYAIALICIFLFILGTVNFIPVKAETVATPSNQWTQVANMNGVRYYSTSVALNDKIYAIGGHNGGAVLSSVEAYDPTTNAWTLVASMKEARCNHISVELNGKIYAIGGGSGLSSVEAYDPKTNAWTTMASMKDGRYDATSVVLNGKIYVIGGRNQSGIVSSIEVYDPGTSTWKTAAVMRDSRYLATSVVLNGKIYIIGGASSSASLSSVEVYDPATSVLIVLPSMKNARHYSTSVALNGKIYAIGGYNSLASAEVYDPATNVWTGLPNMSNGRHVSTSVAVNGKIYAIGGYNSAGYTSSTEIYNPETNTWTILPNMKEGRAYQTSVVLNDRIYAIGGFGSSKSVLSSVEAYQVYDIKLNKIDSSLNVGQTDTLTTTSIPTGIAVTWVSSDPSVATVDSNGKVTAIKAGIANIIAKATDGSNFSVTCKVTVTPASQPETVIVLNKTSSSINVGKTDNLIATITPTGIGVTWTSSDSSIATVNSIGKVTGIKEGIVNITATTTDQSNKAAVCIVTVTPAPKPETLITLNKTSSSVAIGGTDKLIATITPSNVSVIWSSQDTSIATVDSSGIVTAVGAGTTTITATTADGKTATCEVTVRAKQRAKLTIMMANYIREYDLSMEELNAFLEWYDARANGVGKSYFIFTIKATGSNTTYKEYIPYVKIEYFDIAEYEES